MYYRTTSHFLKADPICPSKNNIKNRMTIKQSIFHRLSSHAPTVTVQTSTSSMQTTSQSLNGWVKTKLSDGYTARLAVADSANAKAHLCNTLSCRKPMLYALSNVSATAAPLKPLQTSVNSMPVPCRGYCKRQANVPLISTAYSLKTLTSPSKRCKWMNCTVKLSKINATVRWLMCPKSFVNVLVPVAELKKGQDMAAYGFGREKQIFARIYHCSKNARNCCATDCLGSGIFQSMSRAQSRGQRPSADSCRRSFAIPTGYLAGIWRYKALPSQKWQRQIQISQAQTTWAIAGRRSKETSRLQRQFVEGIEQSVVWQKETNRKAYSKAGHWSQDQYLSYGTTQRHYKRPTSSLDKTYSQRFSSGRDAAIFDMAVAGFVQLDKAALFVAGRNTCDGVGLDRRDLDCFEIYFVSGSCQRSFTLGLGRAA
jgi:hypothetical protein